MRKIIFFLTVVLSFSANVCASVFDENGWKVEKSTHFLIYYKNAQKDFVFRAQEKAEGYYGSIAEELGFNRFDFWLWDKRAKIYIYDDADDYQKNTGKPLWSGGSTYYHEKVIQTFPWAQGFVDSLLPHELGHIIFREFVGETNSFPAWLDEGVAMFYEKSRQADAKKELALVLKEGRLITLDKLSDMNIAAVTDTDLVKLYYLESFSVVDYLVKEFGKDNFIEFCRTLKDKKAFNDAIYSGYKVFKNLEELNKGWIKWIEN